MNQAKRVFDCLRFAYSVNRTGFCRSSWARPQVTQSFHLSSFTPQFRTPASFFNAYRKLFSSKPEPVIDLVLSSDWSKEIEENLEKLDSPPSHEAVMFILKRLDKDPSKAEKFFNWVVGSKNCCKKSSAFYSLMLRIYASNNSMQEFWVIVREMKEKGLYIDEETYKSLFSIFRSSKMDNDAAALKHFYLRMINENCMGELVNSVVGAIKGSDWGHELENELEDMSISVSDNFVLRVLKLLREVQCPLKAVRFFTWVTEKLGFVHSSITYNGILRVLCKEESIEEFWSLMRDMKSAGYDLDFDSYIKISRNFQKNKMFGDAVKLYECMMDSPYKPSTEECSILLRSIAACNPPDLDLLFRVVKKYEATGNSLSKPMYDVIYRALTSLSKFEEAEKTMLAMRNAGYEPDNITYSQLIWGLCKAGRVEEACEVIDVMDGQGCCPDVKTWTILIQGLFEAKSVDKAFIWFAKMMDKNVAVDANLLDVLVNGFLAQRKVVGAYQFLEEMMRKGNLRPYPETYKNLIQNLLGERNLEEALHLLKEMKGQNYQPFAEPFYQHISKLGTIEDAEEFLKAFQATSVSNYLHVFKAFFDEGRHSEAKELLYKCPNHIRKHPKICSLAWKDQCI
ncbi:unnamed protein product [Cuscuta epithymum]|uniref:Pentatricopeptide repeat-containing protein n=1 Tax=Cuscuta epithymum TaxID=186058 RepID=A0AAV0DNJ0_9ASTE|nr:unnamed protein product [Cuscuta epithymum]